MNRIKRLLTLLLLTCGLTTGLWASSIPGALSGRFTINASGDKVQFSQGNLQWSGTNGWRFASNQWDIIGSKANNTSPTSSNDNYMDLFCWGATGLNGVAPNTADSYLSGSSVLSGNNDWGTNMGASWRTLTSDEWAYLFNTRASGSTVNGTSNARYTHATINTDGTGVNGMILFPDGVTIANDEATSWGAVNAFSNWEDATKCTSAQWTALAAKGCVFLPAAGSRLNASVSNDGMRGDYWSSDAYSATNACCIAFTTNYLSSENSSKARGFSIRLVKDYTLQQDAEGNYLLGSADDWNLFANGINDGTIAINANAKLMADNITVTAMIGNSSHRYAGTFDGNNKTITLSISGTAGFEAPFSYINGATIKDLTVSGTLSGGIHCSGLIGLTNGTNNVNNVVVNCVITATGSHCSGLLGRHDAGTTTLNGCAFTGSISKASGNCNVGVLWGWSNGGTAILTNCLENGTYTNCSPLQPIGNLPTNTITNTFYVSNVSSSYGTRVYTSTQDGEVNGLVTAVDGNNYYALTDISGINERYELLGASVSPEPVVKFVGTTLTKDADYTVSYSNNTSRGTGSVIITGAGSYSGTKTINFAVAATNLSGSGTEGSPFTIGSDDDWTEFAASVNSGFTFSGMYVKMTANVNASSMAGQYDGEPFSGTFDGDSKTLNLSIVNSGSSGILTDPSTGTAPFHYIKNAVIKNVKTTGSVSATSIHASGLVGLADGTNTILGCTVSATINTTSNYVGGVLAHGITSNTTIQDCIFDGIINGSSGGSSYVAGLYGWSHGGSPVVKNCLENGTYTNFSLFNPVFLSWQGGASVSDTYYLSGKNSGGDYGTLVYTAVPDGEMCGQVTAVDGNNYYALTTVSGINEKYQLLDESVTPVPVVKFFDTTLTQNTDYTVSYSNNTSGGTGSVIITGINDYTGTKTVNFKIAANTLTGSGTEEDPYVISSDDDWTSFANSVNSGFTYSGEFVKLTKNVNATVNVGLRNNEPFSGTFDGDGHTLTVTLTANAASTSGNTEGIAPFHFIRNATIKNLRTAGTITSTTNHTSGLVGFALGSNTIQNCIVSTSINTTSSYAGGYIGHSQNSAITIRDCLFNGTIKGNNSSYIAGYWGWNGGGSGSLTNCLENGTYVNCSNTDAIGWAPSFTPTNTYRVASSSRGTAVTAEQLADGTVASNLQASRLESVWKQDGFTNQPMPTLFADKFVYTMSSSGLGTFSSKAKFALPEGLEVYYCKDYADEKISVVAINGVVPAETGVLLRGTGGETYTLTISNETAETVTDNALVAVTDQTTIQQTEDINEVNYTNFGLSSGAFKKVNAKGGTVKANRAYLHLPTSALTSAAQARGITLVWDEDVTSIRSIDNGQLIIDNYWYTLDGCRLNGKPTAKGIYIVNGKKVVIN